MPLQRRIPKRGFTNIFKKQYCIVNLGDLERFPADTDVGVQQLVEAGLIKKTFESIKLLADGEITHPLTIHVHKASASAIQKIEAAGGKVELIAIQKRK